MHDSQQLDLFPPPSAADLLRRFAGLDPAAVTFSATETATLMGVTLPTLDTWRSRGQGPVFIKAGRHVRYRLSDILTFQENNRFARASDAKQRDRRAPSVTA